MKRILFLSVFFLLSVYLDVKYLVAENKTDEVHALVTQPLPEIFLPALMVKAQGDFQSLVIPLKRAGKLIMIEGVVDSVQGNLILDTGSTSLVLNSIYFRKARRSGNQVSGGITGAMKTISKSMIKMLQISDVFYQNIEADVTDLGHLENARNIKILGFFGLSMLTDFEIVIDISNNVLELHKTDRDGNRLNSKEKRPSFDLNLPVFNSSDVLFVEAKINKRNYVFCLDTGAESNVLSSQLPDKILSTVTVLRRSSLRGVGSKKVDVFHGIMNDFSIGNRNIKGMQALITNLAAMAESYGQHIDGMLGCDFFEKGVFYIDLKQKNLGVCFHKNQEE